MPRTRIIKFIFGLIAFLVALAVATGVCRRYYYPHPEIGELLLDHLVHAHRGPHDHNLTDNEKKVIQNYIKHLQTILEEDQLKKNN